jgi:hypothetical protein
LESSENSELLFLFPLKFLIGLHIGGKGFAYSFGSTLKILKKQLVQGNSSQQAAVG